MEEGMGRGGVRKYAMENTVAWENKTRMVGSKNACHTQEETVKQEASTCRGVQKIRHTHTNTHLKAGSRQ
jgi:hypothetical protein